MGATSIICKKSYGAPAQFAYWTLDEVGGARVDNVNSVVLGGPACAGTTNSGEALCCGDIGLYGNAAHFYPAVFPTGNFQISIGDQTIPIPQLATTGNGFSFAGWLKLIILGAAYGAVQYSGAANEGVVSLNWNSVHVWFNCGDASAQTEQIDLLPPMNTWFFFHIFYDKLLNKFGFSINNAAPTYAVMVPVIGAFTLGMVYLWQGGMAAASEWLVDEIIVRLDGILTAPQLAYLYNGGGGRTWPIVLP